MLSRSVQGLYWMGRYLERTERLSHLLQLQTEALVDRPVRDIYAGWRRIYGGLQREPPVGSLSLADSDDLELVWSPRSDDFTLADSYTLAGDLTFERTNPDSILNCLAQGRENARQTRHLITTEMWLRLNLAYLRIRNLEIEDIWAALPEDFYAGIIAETDAFAGAAAATMYRDEGWRFLQLGRFVERAQFLPALLLEADGYRRLGRGVRRRRLDEPAADLPCAGSIRTEPRSHGAGRRCARPARHRSAAAQLTLPITQ